MKSIIPILIILLISGCSESQSNKTSEADILRGALRPERTCFDVSFYDLEIKVDLDQKFISGKNDIYFDVLENTSRIQLDLFANMKIDGVFFDGESMPFSRRHNAFFVNLPMLKKGQEAMISIQYSGYPTKAKLPPWEGGFSWEQDENRDPWVGVSCEGIGASLWWPNKDHLSDEPDSMSIRIEVPGDLTCVSNGTLRSIKPGKDNTSIFHWFVHYPINNYNVTLNIAKYAHFSDSYESLDGGLLDLDYYVLESNLEKAKEHFKQVQGVLEAYEFYFGKYPFWKDGFSLVETPYLGMEHQSAIAYGNGFQRGYLGAMIPEDLDFDYVIVHEAGHEYWGNCISVSDHAEMWIHEGFTTYLEALYVEYHYGPEKAREYLMYQRPFIRNREPMVGPLHVNFDEFAASDEYYKGSWVLHTLRYSMDNDEQWFDLLRNFYNTHACSVITSEIFESFVDDFTGKDFSGFFQQYLHQKEAPVLLYQSKEDDGGVRFRYRWSDKVARGFAIPVRIFDGKNIQAIYPTHTLGELYIEDCKAGDIQFEKAYGYYQVKRSTLLK